LSKYQRSEEIVEQFKPIAFGSFFYFLCIHNEQTVVIGWVCSMLIGAL
jgi:hypothetical protein